MIEYEVTIKSEEVLLHPGGKAKAKLKIVATNVRADSNIWTCSKQKDLLPIIFIM